MHPHHQFRQIIGIFLSVFEEDSEFMVNLIMVSSSTIKDKGESFVKLHSIVYTNFLFPHSLFSWNHPVLLLQALTFPNADEWYSIFHNSM